MSKNSQLIRTVSLSYRFNWTESIIFEELRLRGCTMHMEKDLAVGVATQTRLIIIIIIRSCGTTTRHLSGIAIFSHIWPRRLWLELEARRFFIVYSFFSFFSFIHLYLEWHTILLWYVYSDQLYFSQQFLVFFSTLVIRVCIQENDWQNFL